MRCWGSGAMGGWDAGAVGGWDSETQGQWDVGTVLCLLLVLNKNDSSRLEAHFGRGLGAVYT